MTQLKTLPAAADFDRATAVVAIPGRPGEFAVELQGG